MKVRDWYNFNFENEQFRCNLGDVYIKVFRKESCKHEDLVFEQLMNTSDMLHLFGDYKIFILGKDTKNDYCTICIYIYKID